ncbi:MAG TPA: DUF4388 domain-containing protein [Nannocystis sp.]|jgi:CheY-like chemotaxis protein
MQVHARRPAILVVDDEPASRAATVQDLGDPFEVQATDHAGGFRAAIEHAPDLMIVNVESGAAGWALVKQVRCRPERALVPCIFIAAAASPEDRLRGFQLGADDFVRKPLRPGELVQRVQGSLQRQARIVGTVRDHLQAQAGVAGTLEAVGLPALLALLEMERKTGVLSLLRRDPPHEANLYIRDGHLYDAQLGGRRPRSHAEAVYDLLRWHSGRFEFVARPLDVVDAIGLSTAELLQEGARRIDDSVVGPLPTGP